MANFQTETITRATQGFPDTLSFDTTAAPVYAVMVTGKTPDRLPFARNAVLNFLAQDYANRHLVVVNDGPFGFRVPDLPDNRLTQIRPPGRESLGALRNLGLDAVPEDAVWIQWDDDDWRHPKLMSTQKLFLDTAAVEACLLQNQVKHDFRTGRSWIDGHPGGFAGTMMARNAADLRYPAIVRAEDSHFCHAIKQTRPWVAWPNPPRFYLRFLHGGSTWADHHEQTLQRMPETAPLPRKTAAYLTEVLRSMPWPSG